MIAGSKIIGGFGARQQLRVAKAMRYDFHVHSSDYSPCAVSSAAEMGSRASRLGLAGIAFSEHDACWPLAKLQKLQQQFSNLTIMAGIEYSCREGHFLVFLPEPERGALPPGLSVLELIRLVHQQEGIVIWAHPFRYDRRWPGWLEKAQLDGIEVASTNMDAEAAARARKVAASKQIMPLKNSDAHHVDMLGIYWNKIEITLNNSADFIRYVRRQHNRP